MKNERAKRAKVKKGNFVRVKQFKVGVICAVIAMMLPYSSASAAPQDAQAESQSKLGENVEEELVPLLPSWEYTPEEDATTEEIEEFRAQVESINEHNASLSPQTDVVTLQAAGVEIDMGKTHYFLAPDDARKVLVDLWENPYNPELLGMIFARNTDAYSNDYAVAVYFESSGYVSDEDAATIDYDELLQDMKTQTEQESKSRKSQGYDGMTMIGWGADPKYNAAQHHLSWAQLLKFDEAETNTLNYNMRFLGRKGVLEFRYIADESALPVLDQAMPDMSSMASFKAGHRYTDFNPETDKVAAYGIAGLVAGGVVAKKLGLLGILILFLKKGWILIFAALAFGRRFITGLFKSDSKEP